MDSFSSPWENLDIFLQKLNSTTDINKLLSYSKQFDHDQYTTLLQLMGHFFISTTYDETKTVKPLDDVFKVKKVELDFLRLHRNFLIHKELIQDNMLPSKTITKDELEVEVTSLEHLAKDLAYINEDIRHLLFSIDAQFNCPFEIRKHNIIQMVKLMILFYSEIYPTLMKKPMPFLHENYFVLINFLGDIIAPSYFFSLDYQKEHPDLTILFLHVIGVFFSYSFIQLVVAITLSQIINNQFKEEDLLFKDEPLRFVDFQDDAPKLSVFFVQQFLEFFTFFDQTVLPTLPTHQQDLIKDHFAAVRNSVEKTKLLKKDPSS